MESAFNETAGSLPRKRGTRRSSLALIVASLVVVLLVPAGLMLAISVFDDTAVRKGAERWFGARFGRELRIGSLQVDVWSRHPSIEMRDMTIGNASWGTGPYLVEAERIFASVTWSGLLRGELVFADVELDRPRVLLEQRGDREANWRIGPESGAPASIPLIDTLEIRRGLVTWRDPVQDTDLTLAINSTADNRGPPVRIRIHGRAFGGSAEGELLTSMPSGLVTRLVPMQIKGDARIADTHIAIDGTAGFAGRDTSLVGRFELRGPDLARLHQFTGIALPHTAPYVLRGRVDARGRTVDVADLEGTVGKSDVRGTVSVIAGEPVRVSVRLESRLLDLADLGGFLGATPRGAAPRGPKILPARPYNLGALRRLEADGSLVAKSIRRPAGAPFDDLKAHFVMQNGALRIAPLDFGFAGGTVAGVVTAAVLEETIRAGGEFRFQRLSLAELLPGTARRAPGAGSIDGTAQLQGQGSSFGAILAQLNGKAGLVMRSGEMSNLLLELAGLDGAEAVRYLVGGDRSVPIRCGVLGLTAKQGILTSDVLVLDTSDTVISGRAHVDLARETLAVDLYPEPKDVSIAVLRAPIHISGSFANPAISVDKGGIAARAGAAILLGMVNPLAALIPLLEPGLGKDAPCDELTARVTASANSTPAPRK